jgi:hypothetical protein
MRPFFVVLFLEAMWANYNVASRAAKSVFLKKIPLLFGQPV